VDIADLTAEERQRVLWGMELAPLEAVLRQFMETRRPTELPARLDALTVYAIKAAK
jgi:hypothetical protein